MSSTAASADPKATAEAKKEDAGVNIQVVVRCRPLNDGEKTAGEVPVVTVAPAAGEITVGSTVKRTKTYTFDKVFGQYSTQEEVFNVSIVPIIEEVLQGFNCTVFAYGQTGTGKTHTMEGEMGATANAGIIPRSLHMLFEKLTRTASEFSVRLSFMELYNEQLEDLMFNEENEPKVPAPLPAGGKREESHRLRIVEDARKGTVVQGLEEIPVKDASEAFELLNAAIRKRRVAETLMNKASSRSHSIFTVTIHMKETTTDGEDLMKVGKLNLVDLAGSECVGRSGAKNERLREAGNINQSLLTLGRVINALVEHSGHVPYRDSKLTRLLQDSLGGKTKTCIIATLSPSPSSLEETLSTLDYANRAKDIKNRPQQNQKMTKRALIREYIAEIEKLREELKCAREKNGVFLPPERYDELTRNIAAQSGNIKELEDLLGAQKSELEGLRSQVDGVRVALDEMTVIAAAHEATEAALRAEAQTVAATLTQSVTDVSLLHDKIARKATVESDNASTVSLFLQGTEESVSSLHSSIDTFRRQQSERYGGMLSGLSSLSEHVTTQAAGLSETIQTINVAVDTMVDQSVSFCQTFVANGSAQFNGLTDGVSSFQSQFSDVMTASGDEIKRELSGLSTLLQQQQRQLDVLTQMMTSFVSTSHSSVTAFCDDHSSRVDACKSSLAKLSADVTAQLAAQSNATAQFVDARKAAQSAFVAQLIASLQQQQAAEFASFDAHCSSVSATGKQVSDAVATSVSMASTELSDIQTATQTWSSEHASRVSQYQAGQIAWVDQQRGLIEGCDTFRSQVGSKIDSQLQSASNDVSQVLESFKSSIGLAKENLSSFAGSLCEDMTASKSLVTDQSSDVVSKTFTFAADMIKHVESQKLHVNAAVEAERENAASVDGAFARIEDSLTAFAGSGLKVDVPTGVTPAKKVYPLPTAFASTEPHNLLIAKHKASLASYAGATPLKTADVKLTFSSTPASKLCL